MVHGATRPDALQLHMAQGGRALVLGSWADLEKSRKALLRPWRQDKRRKKDRFVIVLIGFQRFS